MRNLGQCKPVGQGIYELKIDFGPNYRLYSGTMSLALEEKENKESESH